MTGRGTSELYSQAKTYNTRDSPVVTHPSTSLAIVDLVYRIWGVWNWPVRGQKMAASDLEGRAISAHSIC